MEHNHLERIEHKKHFFIKTFVISLVLMIILCLIATMAYNHMAYMASMLYDIDMDDYGKIFVMTFAIWKILIIQFTLVPAIAFAMIEKHIKKHMKENDKCDL